MAAWTWAQRRWVHGAAVDLLSTLWECAPVQPGTPVVSWVVRVVQDSGPCCSHMPVPVGTCPCVLHHTTTQHGVHLAAPAGGRVWPRVAPT
jgi:hypothetical protein